MAGLFSLRCQTYENGPAHKKMRNLSVALESRSIFQFSISNQKTDAFKFQGG